VPARVEPRRDKTLVGNMFCSTCEPPAVAAGAGEPAEIPVTKLPLTLVSTVNLGGGERNAIVINKVTGAAGSFAPGERIPGAGEVVSVKAQSVHIKNKESGRLERIALDTPSQPQAQGQPQPQGQPEPQPQAQPRPGVHKIDDTHYVIDRAFADKTIADPGMFMRSIRAAPDKDGGWRILPPGRGGTQLLDQFGLATGDVIRTINGWDLSTPDKMLEVMGKLKSATSLHLSISRGGREMALDYAIH
jgi:general secretion pathway protein C